MHASLAVHVCTELGTTAQILQRTCKKSAMRLQNILSGLQEKRIALFQRKQVRFLDLPVRSLQIRAVR